jgi:hypothetical protein
MDIGALPILFGMMKVDRRLLELRMPSGMAIRVTGSTQNLTESEGDPMLLPRVPRIWATSEYLSGEEFL